MSLVKTNTISLQCAIESSLGVLPGSPTWALLEPNTINSFGAKVTKTARNPISKLRQRRKGTTTDLDSGVEFEADLTREVFATFAEAFVFASFTSIVELRAGAAFNTLLADDDTVVAGTDSGYTHSALGAAVVTNSLLYARGFAIAGNNGLKVVKTGSTTTSTLITTALVDETPSLASNARVSVCGVRSAVGDVDLTVTGTLGSLTSTVLDFTTLGLTVGQLIHIGGLTATNQFASGRLGAARITSIAAHAIGLDKIRSTPAATALQTEANTTQALDILFGRFLRNVDVDHASYLERSFTFELAYPDLAGIGTDAYEYAAGNFGDTMSIDIPGQDKATVTFGFVGTDTPAATTSRVSGAATPLTNLQTTAFNTSADLARLRVENTDLEGLSSCFKSLKLTLANGVTPEKCLGTLGAVGMNTGNFLVDIEAKVTFDNTDVTGAIRNNETCTIDFVLKNGDGAIGFDIPAMTLGGGDKEFPVGETVLMNMSGEAFADATLGTSLGISLFPVYPQ